MNSVKWHKPCIPRIYMIKSIKSIYVNTESFIGTFEDKGCCSLMGSSIEEVIHYIRTIYAMHVPKLTQYTYTQWSCMDSIRSVSPAVSHYLARIYDGQSSHYRILKESSSLPHSSWSFLRDIAWTSQGRNVYISFHEDILHWRSFSAPTNLISMRISATRTKLGP